MNFPGTLSVACFVFGFAVAPGLAQSPAAQGHGTHAASNSPRSAYTSHQLHGDDRIVHALNRFTFGPGPGDVEAVRAMGLENWFDAQLHPERMDQTELNARLAAYPAMQWSVHDLSFWLPGNATIRQTVNEHRPIPDRGAQHAIYANQIYRMDLRKAEESKKKDNTAAVSAEVSTETSAATMSKEEVGTILALAPAQRVERLVALPPEQHESFVRALHPPQRQLLLADLTPEQREIVNALENPEREVSEELMAQRLTRDIASRAQLQEVMTDFWFNHFNVYLHKDEQTPYYLVGYERDTLRPHALGKFEDLLESVAHSPAMLLYLDNSTSIGPDSLSATKAGQAALRQPKAKRKAPEGLNENYARELMELHTLGVDGGYLQADVIQVARVLTGWTIDHPQFGGGFIYQPNRHEPGAKKVLGHTIDEAGEAEGHQLLHLLAMQPATARFLAHKLAVRFVSDTPPPALEDRLAKSYLASGGDISTVLRTLFHSHEFWSTESYRAKVKTPLEYVVSAVRASHPQLDNMQPLANAMRQMGMPLYGAMPPTGYKWDAADWVSASAMINRMNFALSLAANRLPGVVTAWGGTNGISPDFSTTPAPEIEEARLEHLLIAGGVSRSTRAAAVEQLQATQPNANKAPTAKAASAALEREDRLLAGLLLGSPEFQRR